MKQIHSLPPGTIGACPPFEVVSAYAENQLPPGDPAAAHIDTCPRCQRLVAACKIVDAQYRLRLKSDAPDEEGERMLLKIRAALDAQVHKKTVYRPCWRNAMKAAACVMAGSLVILLWMLNTPEDEYMYEDAVVEARTARHMKQAEADAAAYRAREAAKNARTVSAETAADAASEALSDFSPWQNAHYTPMLPSQMNPVSTPPPAPESNEVAFDMEIPAPFAAEKTRDAGYRLGLEPSPSAKKSAPPVASAKAKPRQNKDSAELHADMAKDVVAGKVEPVDTYQLYADLFQRPKTEAALRYALFHAPWRTDFRRALAEFLRRLQ